MSDGRMTAAEREALCRLVRDNARVARADADARGKWLLADVEAKLAARFKREDEDWAEVVALGEKAVEEANAQVAAACRSRGVPEEFWPSMGTYWLDRGENALAGRRGELRKVAQAQVAARVAAAKVEIDRQAVAQQTQITRLALTSEEARAFIAALPGSEELLPPISALELRKGKVVELGTTVTAVTPETPAGAGETASRNRCAYCNGEMPPGRSDSKFCKPSCRVANHRRLRAAANLSDQPPAE
jgi:hypothetical protein